MNVNVGLRGGVAGRVPPEKVHFAENLEKAEKILGAIAIRGWVDTFEKSSFIDYANPRESMFGSALDA